VLVSDGGNELKVRIAWLVFLEICPDCGRLVAWDCKMVAESSAGLNDGFACYLWRSDGCPWDNLGCAHGSNVGALFDRCVRMYLIVGRI